MTGLTLWGPRSTAGYPADEPDLPAEIPIRRAFGGPLSRRMRGLGLALLTRLPSPAGFAAVKNLLVFGGGAFLPRGFNAGSALLYWWPKRGRQTE